MQCIWELCSKKYGSCHKKKRHMPQKYCSHLHSICSRNTVICSIIQITLWWYYYINVIICIRYMVYDYVTIKHRQTQIYRKSYHLFYSKYMINIGPNHLVWDRIQTRFQGIKVDTENRGPLHTWARHQAKLGELTPFIPISYSKLC